MPIRSSDFVDRTPSRIVDSGNNFSYLRSRYGHEYRLLYVSSRGHPGEGGRRDRAVGATVWPDSDKLLYTAERSMSLQSPLASDHQLARLLQIGVVLEEVVEARAAKHASESDDIDSEVRAMLEEAVAESEEHRKQLEGLVDKLDADTVGFEEIQRLVEQQYEADEDFDGVLYDQLCNEETAYKFYDDLVAAIEGSDVSFSVDREHLLGLLRDIRAEEEAGVEAVTALMEREKS
jgi:DNA-binding transcriptional MerR regulator